MNMSTNSFHCTMSLLKLQDYLMDALGELKLLCHFEDLLLSHPEKILSVKVKTASLELSTT